MSRRTIRPSILIAACCFSIALLFPHLVLGRAGGGEGYSGGGGGSGGHGSGGGDGILWLVFQLFRLCFYYPKVGVPILLIVVGFFIYASIKGKGTYQSSVIRKANASRDTFRQPEIVALVRQADPSFNPDAFLPRVRSAFTKIQSAWSAQNLAEVRPFISDAVYERFSLQFDEQRALGYRNRMDQVNVLAATLAHAQSDANFDELSVRIAASAVDQKVDANTGRAISGASGSQPFVEVWSFLRRRGATTHADKPGLMEGRCPNCGAAIEMNQSANCQYCSALLRSGQFDWVLAEITQECEWEPSERESLPGVAELARRDPHFNPQELEDRASVIFWRRATAERLQSVEPLRKVALDPFCQNFVIQAKGIRGQPRSYYGECAVGSVDTLGIIPAGGVPSADGETFDRALVEIRWSGRQFFVDPAGAIRRGDAGPVVHVLQVLARKPSAVSNPDQSISSAHCPNCGAPENGGSSGACNFCGVILNDGSKSWALEEETLMSTDRADVLLAALHSAPVPVEEGGPPALPSALPPTMPSSGPPPLPARRPTSAAPVSVLAWMVKMTLADGQIDAKEREMLMSVAARYQVPRDRLEGMIAAAQNNALDLPAPANADEARSHLNAMARIALADGKISGEEYTLLQTTGQGLGLSDYDVKQLLKQCKSEMYAEAKTLIRSAKSGKN